jgi:hypothetical protein
MFLFLLAGAGANFCVGKGISNREFVMKLALEYTCYLEGRVFENGR